MMQSHYTSADTGLAGVGMLDITAPDVGVEIRIRADKKVVWVDVDGVTALRICRIPMLSMETDSRKVTWEGRNEEPVSTTEGT